jgi:hypothetical protein
MSNQQQRCVASLTHVLSVNIYSAHAGEDVIYIVHCGVKCLTSAASLTAATLKCSRCSPPPDNFSVLCDSAIASAKDKMYMLGGEILCGVISDTVTPLRVYEPRIDSWWVLRCCHRSLI